MPKVPAKEAAKTKLLRFFQQNVGRVLTTHDLARVAGIITYQRRIRELRGEGWPIESHHDRHGLKPGQYVMASSERRAPEHEHKVPAAVRRHVLLRDSVCQMCGLGPGDPHPALAGRRVRLQVDHIDPKGPPVPDNLRALCSACHEGRSNLETPPPEVLNALATIRRAPRSVQVSVHEFLKRKFERA